MTEEVEKWAEKSISRKSKYPIKDVYTNGKLSSLNVLVSFFCGSIYLKKNILHFISASVHYVYPVKLPEHDSNRNIVRAASCFLNCKITAVSLSF